MQVRILNQLAEKWDKLNVALKAQDVTLSIGEDGGSITLPKSTLKVMPKNFYQRKL